MKKEIFQLFRKKKHTEFILFYNREKKNEHYNYIIKSFNGPTSKCFLMFCSKHILIHTQRDESRED